MGNADALSRLPLPDTISDVPLPADLSHLLNRWDDSIFTATQIKQWTDKDPLLSRVLKLVRVGWTVTYPTPDMQHHHQRHSELSVLDGCIFWGSRFVVPTAGHTSIMNQLHETHPGVSKMKLLARSCVWWQSEIEEK